MSLVESPLPPALFRWAIPRWSHRLWGAAWLGQTAWASSSSEQAGVEISSPVSNILQPFFYRMFESGPIVSLVLLILIGLSISTWAIVCAKWIYLRRIEKNATTFVKSFWDSRSLNDLNGRLGDHPYSPMREIFRCGYAELVRSSQLKEQTSVVELAIHASIDNLTRTLQKSKQNEKKNLERFLAFLATSASASPFIGLFGTVWGIMVAFEGIAASGNSSLAAVAPGISEALIATAFGLAAAIPATVGYNIAASKIRTLSVTIDGFAADFLNIVERYLVADKKNSAPASSSLEQDQSLRL